MPKYFTKETDEYIKKFVLSEDPEEKQELFDEGIRPAFEKLIENLIFVYKFFNLDDIDTLKKDCLTNLYEMLPKFKIEKHTKGFSYFNVVARNWFIQKTKARAKKSKAEREFYVDIDLETIRNNPSMTFCSHEEEILDREFWMSFLRELDSWRSKFVKKNERILLEASIFLFQNPDMVDIYNKKAIYVNLRDMTGLNEKQIATGLKKMRNMYSEWVKKYHSRGC